MYTFVQCKHISPTLPLNGGGEGTYGCTDAIKPIYWAIGACTYF